jgi:hypothetical protein
MTRRATVGAVLFALCLATSGCVGVLSQDEIRFEADPARIDDATLAETGYERQSNRTITVNRTFELQGQERRVHLTNHVAAYQKSHRGAPLAHAVALTTPAASAFGQSVNPLMAVDDRALVERALDEVARVQNLTHVGNQTVGILGTNATVERYGATAEQNGSSAKVHVQVTRVTHEGDLVVLVGMYPREMDGSESDVLRLFRGVDHPAGAE